MKSDILEIVLKSMFLESLIKSIEYKNSIIDGRINFRITGNDEYLLSIHDNSGDLKLEEVISARGTYPLEHFIDGHLDLLIKMLGITEKNDSTI